MSARRVVARNAAAAAEACARQIIDGLDEALSGRRLASLALSGGGTVRFLFERLRTEKFAWDRVHLFWADERCVPPHDPASNYGVAQAAFIEPERIPPANVHRIHGELLPNAAATQYEQAIRGFFGLAAGEFPRFDVVHLGMGPEAHTASLFPEDPLIDDREGIAAATHPENIPQWRVTLLPGALLPARHIVFLAVGADKQEALGHVLDGPYEPARYPAQVVSRNSANVTWFVDQAAAGFTD